MPITKDSIKHRIYQIGAPNPLAWVNTFRAEHQTLMPTPPALLSTTQRVTDTWTPDANNAKVLHLALAAGGNTYYLPYDNNKITSMRLPSPPPANCTTFFTANMSGCRFYIDTIGGSADLMVYHANARDTAPSPPHSAVNLQLAAATNELDRLHTAAQQDFAAPPYNLALVNVGSLAKPAYYAAGHTAEQRKYATRTMLYPDGHGGFLPGNPEFWGGCSVIGIYNAGWRFYYQTWGAVEYDRPQINTPKEKAEAIVTFHWNHLIKLKKEGNRHGLDIRYAEIVDQRRFYP
jgi:hypothetical protein